MGKSNISYLDYVYSPVTGCSGTGCKAHCYAREIVRRFPLIHWNGDSNDLPVNFFQSPFFEKVRFHPDRLSEPLHWKKPRVIGVCFFGDWMDDQVRPSWIDQILEVISACPQHQFVSLTKQARNLEPKIYGFDEEVPCRELGGGDYLPNLWNGVTVCTQAEADERIPELLKVPGKKWLSIEPMLGPVIINPFWLECVGAFECDKRRPDHGPTVCHPFPCPPRIHAVILGGESGPKRRPLHPDWVRSVRDQCAASGVPFYFKSWGNPKKERILDGLTHDDLPWRS